MAKWQEVQLTARLPDGQVDKSDLVLRSNFKLGNIVFGFVSGWQLTKRKKKTTHAHTISLSLGEGIPNQEAADK